VGIRNNFRRVKNNYIVEEQDENGEWFPLFNFSNDFQYDESIQAAYAIIGNSGNRISWEVGLRGEYTDIRTDLVPLDPSQEEEVNNKEYFDLFPSGSITYKLKGENTIQASYSRRISRPGFWFLNPFSNFSDPRFLRTGNPDLDPVYTDSYELGYLLNWPSGSLYSSVYYRHSTGEWERITLVDDEGVSTSFPVNLSTEDAVGFEFNYSQDIADWWTMNANANVFYSVTDGEFSDVRYYAENLSFNGRLNSRWKVWKKLDVQANYRYRAPQTTTQGRRQSFSVLDLGISMDVLSGNGTLVANVNDVFNTGIYRGITEGENFYSEGSYRRRVRQFTLNFTYRINQKKKRERGGGGRGNGGDFEGEF
jgi:outer membrane receptor protein involved in Fe transport